MEYFLESNSEYFLIDPALFESNFSLIKKKIPVYKKEKKLYVFTKKVEKIQEEQLEIIQKEIDQELLNEKIYLIKNYHKWIVSKIFIKETPIRAIIDFILTETILNNISDIHFNIFSENVFLVKVKKETILSDFCFLTKEQFDSILLCFKVLSSLDTSKRHLPQSSSFFKIFRGDIIDFRVSTHPTFFGERFVIRILSKKNVLHYKNMHLNKNVEKVIEKIVCYPSGLILFTGPTNSGKTTLIHSIISEISKQNLTIMTLEDPVEYRIPGIIQTNISENGLSFSSGMKSILRQDPDVIFLGEIRDSEVAKIAVQAALTGHKILSTLHAYSIKGAITRLLDMGISSVLLAESLVSIFSQRLLRKKSDQVDEFLGLVLLVDSLFLDEKAKDQIRNCNLDFIKNQLRENADEMFNQGLITASEIRRVLG